MSDASPRVPIPPEPPLGYAGGGAQDPNQPATPVGPATQPTSSEPSVYDAASSQGNDLGESQVTPRLSLDESTGYALLDDQPHSATQSEYLTTSGTTQPCSVPEPMVVDEVENVSKVTPRHSSIVLGPSSITDTADHPDPGLDGSFRT